MIEDRLEEYCKKLVQFPPSVFWIHETVLSNYLGIPRGEGEYGQSDALTSLIACIKNGYGGNLRKRIRKMTGIDQADLFEHDNQLQIRYQHFGKKEIFARGDLAESNPDKKPCERQPRWFHFGSDCPIRANTQGAIVDQLTGQCNPGQLGHDGEDDPAVLPIYIIRRRQKLFQAYFQGDGEGIPYKNFDVPAIAAKFKDTIWNNIEMTSSQCRRRSFRPLDLDFMEQDFRIMLVASNVVGKFREGDTDLINNISVRSARVSVLGSAPPSRNTNRTSPNAVRRTEVATPTRPTSDSSPALPESSQLGESLRLGNLLCTQEGVINWDMFTELASLELLFHLHMTDDISWDCLEIEMKKKGVDLPRTFDPSELRAMTKTNIYNARKNISAAREDWELHMGGKMQLEPYPDEFLYQWDQAAKRFSSGCRVEADNYKLNEGNRQPELSWFAISTLRALWIANNIPIDKVGTLWVFFYTLIMGKKKSKRVMKLLHRKYEGVGGKMTCYNWGDNGSALYAKGSIYDIITSKTRAKELVSSYIATTKKVTSHIYSFLKKEDGSTIIDNKSVKKTDIYFLFVRYVEEAWGGDVIVPAVNAAFNTSRDVDPHFKYTVQDDATIEEEDDASVNRDIDGTAAVTIEDNEGDMGDVDEDDIV